MALNQLHGESGRGLIAAVCQKEDPLNLRRVVRDIEAEFARHDPGIRESEQIDLARCRSSANSMESLPLLLRMLSLQRREIMIRMKAPV
jgi:hypothetical protein